MARGFQRGSGDPEEIFDAFVRNHGTPEADDEGSESGAESSPTEENTRREPYASERSSRSRMGPTRAMTRSGAVPAQRLSSPGQPLRDWMQDEEKEPTAEIVLLTKVKAAVESEAYDEGGYADTDESIREGIEDGQIPAGELDHLLSDMTVLVRYGHLGQVRTRLEELCREYPEDVLLLQRVVEFHMENGDREGTLEMLFLLAGRLFERRNVAGMKKALQQVLVIEPDNRRAYRLLGLLDQRPSTGTGG